VLSWRFRRERGGNGVLGDLASHAVDLVRHVLGPAGEVTGLVARTGVAMPRRPLADGAGSHYAVAAATSMGTAPTGDVENPEWVLALLDTAGGAVVQLEASRVAVGRQNAYGFELEGTGGRLAWDFRRPGELLVGRPDLADAPQTRLLAGPGHGEYAAFQPGAGIALGYDDLKVIEAAGLVARIAGEPGPDVADLDDAVRSAEVLDAMELSARQQQWVPVRSGRRAPAARPTIQGSPR
jgi:predicted dehydrogenase